MTRLSPPAIMRLPIRIRPSTFLAGRAIQPFKSLYHHSSSSYTPPGSKAPDESRTFFARFLEPLGYVAGATLEPQFESNIRKPFTFGPAGVPILWKSTTEIDEKHDKVNAIYPHIWLRDNCQCSSCVNPVTMQRALDTFSIPQDITPEKVITEEDGLKVTWPDGHVSSYPWRWLRRHRCMPALPGDDRGNDRLHQKTTLWGAKIANNPPSVQYDEIMADDKGVGKWTSKIKEFGFCFVEGCPVSPEETKKLLERISFIRETHYGGFYDFTSDLTMKDTAYTSQALQAHTDTTYFSDPAGLQMFHLLSHTDGDGGESLLVDGFHAARVLSIEDSKSLNILCKTKVPWHASGNDGINITPYKTFPVIERQMQGTGVKATHSKPLQIRWNNDDRGPLPLIQYSIAEDWYIAARQWNNILKRSYMEYWVKLVPGRALIFDNWRVLHGRSAFTGKRRICGGYINRDDFVSRWRNTNFTKEQVKEQTL